MLTIRSEMNHIWTTIALTISTSFVQIKVLLNSRTKRNYIIQNLAMQHDLFVVKAIFRDVNIIDDIVLKMFFIYVVNVTTKNNLKKTHEEQSFFIKTNIVDANVILKIKWLKKINFILNFIKKNLNFSKRHVVDLESSSKRIEIDDDFDDEIHREVFELNAMMQIVEERKTNDICNVSKE